MKYLFATILFSIACQQNNKTIIFQLDSDFHGWLYLIRIDTPENRIEKIGNNAYKVPPDVFEKLDSATFYLGDMKLVKNDLKYVNRALYSKQSDNFGKVLKSSDMISVIEIYIPNKEEWEYPNSYWTDRDISRKYRTNRNVIDSIINVIN